MCARCMCERANLLHTVCTAGPCFTHSQQAPGPHSPPPSRTASAPRARASSGPSSASAAATWPASSSSPSRPVASADASGSSDGAALAAARSRVRSRSCRCSPPQPALACERVWWGVSYAAVLHYARCPQCINTHASLNLCQPLSCSSTASRQPRTCMPAPTPCIQARVCSMHSAPSTHLCQPRPQLLQLCVQGGLLLGAHGRGGGSSGLRKEASTAFAAAACCFQPCVMRAQALTAIRHAHSSAATRCTIGTVNPPAPGRAPAARAGWWPLPGAGSWCPPGPGCPWQTHTAR